MAAQDSVTEAEEAPAGASNEAILRTLYSLTRTMQRLENQPAWMRDREIEADTRAQRDMVEAEALLRMRS